MNHSGHETLLVRRGRRSGVHAIIAVHSTALGPALGGCRMWHYPTREAAVQDALRLSGAMTLKAAAAALPLGGGKSVIWLGDDADPPTGAFREAILRDFADALNELDGRYITAEDVGTTSADMAFLSHFSDHVTGRPLESGGAGDPGDSTAIGVEASLRACAQRVFGTRELAGRSVTIVGAGSVGGNLARRLAAGGARLVLADIDPSKRTLADQLGATWAEPERALSEPADVIAPCALGGAIDAARVERLRCRIVCGSANNQLADDGLAATLAARGILYAPDFIVNAGGLINVAMELTGYDAHRTGQQIAGIETLLGRVLDHATNTGVTPLAAATEIARRRLESAGPGALPRPQLGQRQAERHEPAMS